ncbi:hypothetical protein GCM10009818_09900 [Nakamurella flavida]
MSGIREVLLTAAAGLGLISVLAVTAALFLHVSLIVFKTGSMTPAIPAGSVALVREVPASDLAIGDVVTVSRAGVSLPVTHRIVQIDPAADGSAAGRVLTLRGDANPGPDPVTYPVTTVRRVIASAPELGHVVQFLAKPWVLGAMTIFITALVTWTFWPTGNASRRRREDPVEPPTEAISRS